MSNGKGKHAKVERRRRMHQWEELAVAAWAVADLAELLGPTQPEDDYLAGVAVWALQLHGHACQQVGELRVAGRL